MITCDLKTDLMEELDNLIKSGKEGICGWLLWS